jgi:hypothetical protein
MRQGQSVGLELHVPQEEQVYVDRARPVAWTAERTAVLRLDRLADVEQLLGFQVRPDPDGRVEEIGLIEVLPDWLGPVDRRAGLDLRAVLLQVGDRFPQVALGVAEVRAEAQVTGPQISSSSSPSRSSDRSIVTSTPAS